MRHGIAFGAVWAGIMGVAAGACTSDLLGNSEFALWCGDELCNWKIYEDEDGARYGNVEKAPTWHRSDDGVALIGSDVRLYQTVDNSFTDCVTFTLHADAADGVDLFLEVDYDADNVLNPEVSIPMSATDWEISNGHAALPWEMLRYNVIIRKSGAGRAVLARVDAEDGGGCPEEPVRIIFDR